MSCTNVLKGLSGREMLEQAIQNHEQEAAWHLDRARDLTSLLALIPSEITQEQEGALFYLLRKR